MTKTDYVLIAEVIRTTTQFSSVNAQETFARHMASRLKDQNPSFDTDKFVKACFYLGPVSEDMIEVTPLNEAAVQRHKA